MHGFRGAQPPPPDPLLGSVGTQVLTDLVFRCVSNDEAAWAMAGGQKVWRYQFGVPQPGSRQVSHTAELGHVLGTRPAGATFGSWPPVQRYWANFVKTGNPTSGGLIQSTGCAAVQVCWEVSPAIPPRSEKVSP